MLITMSTLFSISDVLSFVYKPEMTSSGIEPFTVIILLLFLERE